jgi:hypothetical protein
MVRDKAMGTEASRGQGLDPLLQASNHCVAERGINHRWLPNKNDCSPRPLRERLVLH